MARIRTIKPVFFLNEQLAELGFSDRLLFIGLWTQADKAGRLEYRPLRIKAALFPYDDLNVSEGLGRLINAGLLIKYEVNGQQLIAIPTWEKHQRPHNTEADSELPAPPLSNGSITVTKPQEGKGREWKGREGNEEGNGVARAPAKPLISGMANPRDWGRIHGNHHGSFCDWVCMPEFLFEEFRAKSAGAEYVNGWAARVRQEWEGRTIGDDGLKFWRTRWAESHPTPKAAPVRKGIAQILQEQEARKAAGR